MLVLTQNAATALEEILASQAKAERTALRVVVRAREDGRSVLMLSLSHPRADDLAVTHRGITLFVERQAVELVDGRLLDAQIEKGGVRFLVAPRASGRR